MGAPGTAVAGRLDVRADRLQVPARRPEQAAGRPAVEIAHLRKTYGQLTAVDDVSFSVTEGEIFGLLGPNGAGKTTTVECAIGLRSPDSGTIRLLGLDPQADRDEVHEIVGAQLQASAFPSKLKVGEILDMYRSFYREPADVGELTEALGLAGKRNDYYKSLSGGQRQRLSVALALIGRPKIAVLDEMTTGLDPQARRDAWELIEGVRGRGVTVILVTHFMEEAERLCDRVALIDNGRVVALDTPARLAAQARGGKSVRFLPSAPFDDRLLTALPEVTRVDREGQHVVVTGTGELASTVILALAAAGVTARDLQTRFVESRRRLRPAHRTAHGQGRSNDMTSLTLPRPGTARRAAFGQIVLNEARLTWRRPVGLIAGVALPVVLLVIFGKVGKFQQPSASLGGLTAFDLYLPILVVFALAMLALLGLPIPLASYRELGAPAPPVDHPGTAVLAADRPGPRPAGRGGDRGRRHDHRSDGRVRGARPQEPGRGHGRGGAVRRRALPHRAAGRRGGPDRQRRERHRPGGVLPADVLRRAVAAAGAHAGRAPDHQQLHPARRGGGGDPGLDAAGVPPGRAAAGPGGVRAGLRLPGAALLPLGVARARRRGRAPAGALASV